MVPETWEGELYRVGFGFTKSGTLDFPKELLYLELFAFWSDEKHQFDLLRLGRDFFDMDIHLIDVS